MKSFFHILLIFAVAGLVSCEKVVYDYTTDKGESVDITMRVTGATDGTSVDGSSLDDAVSQLTFVVFKDGEDQSHEEAGRITQYAGEPNFGSVRLKLSSGKYKAIVVGSKAAFLIRGASATLFQDARMIYFQNNTISQYQTSDTFVATGDIDVKKAHTEDFTLERVVGKIDLEIESAIPYQVTLKNEATELLISERKPGGLIGQPYVQTILDPSANNELFILRTDQPLELEISSADASQSLSVTVEKNKRTLIQGSLKKPNEQINLNVVLEEGWSSDTTRIEL